MDDALSGATAIEVRRGNGRWARRSLDTVLFDGTRASLRNWAHAGAGSIDLTAGGVLRTSGGLGLFWYTAREFKDATFRLQWRDARTDGVRSNGGVFPRFPPGPADEPCDLALPPALGDFTWHAIACGVEVQINDGPVDPQQTGSIYTFQPLDPQGARPAPFGAWNDYEVRVTGAGSYEVQVVRDGYVINRWVNTHGQVPALIASDPIDGLGRAIYPPSDLKQYRSGLFGLQNHGDADTLEYRNVRALVLGPREVAIPRRGRHRALIRAVDAAGNRSRAIRLAPR